LNYALRLRARNPRPTSAAPIIPNVAGSGAPVIADSVALSVITSEAPVIAPPATVLPAFVRVIVKLDKFRPETVLAGVIVTAQGLLLLAVVVTLQKIGAVKTAKL